MRKWPLFVVALIAVVSLTGFVFIDSDSQEEVVDNHLRDVYVVVASKYATKQLSSMVEYMINDMGRGDTITIEGAEESFTQNFSQDYAQADHERLLFKRSVLKEFSKHELQTLPRIEAIKAHMSKSTASHKTLLVLGDLNMTAHQNSGFDISVIPSLEISSIEKAMHF